MLGFNAFRKHMLAVLIIKSSEIVVRPNELCQSESSVNMESRPPMLIDHSAYKHIMMCCDPSILKYIKDEVSIIF